MDGAPDWGSFLCGRSHVVGMPWRADESFARHVIEILIAAGKLPPEVDADVTADLLIGPVEVSTEGMEADRPDEPLSVSSMTSKSCTALLSAAPDSPRRSPANSHRLPGRSGRRDIFK